MDLEAVSALKPGKAINSQSLEQAVRSAGGIRGGSGELRDLGIRQSGTTGLINNKTGRQADILAEEMHRRGFIPDADPATLFDALRNGGGRKLYANDAVDNNGLQRMAEAEMGDMPGAERIPVPVPFGEFQRLRRDSGELAAKIGDRGGQRGHARGPCFHVNAGQGRDQRHEQHQAEDRKLAHHLIPRSPSLPPRPARAA